jgi:hypothetical protein
VILLVVLVVLTMVICFNTKSFVWLASQSDASVTVSTTRTGNTVKKLFEIPDGTRFCLVHVGKTAGKTVSCQLGQHSFCKNRHETPAPSSLQKAFAARTHMWGHTRDCERSANVTAFIYMLRNPIDRLASWYFFEHPRKDPLSRDLNGTGIDHSSCPRLFHKGEGWNNNDTGCFATLEEFAMHTLPPPHSNDCQQLAWEVATGKRRCRVHNSMGYSYYFNRIQQIKKQNITYTHLAIRNEHLAIDWDQLDAAFSVNVNNKSLASASGTRRFDLPQPTNRNGRPLQRVKTTTEIAEHDQLSSLARNNCVELCVMRFKSTKSCYFWHKTWINNRYGNPFNKSLTLVSKKRLTFGSVLLLSLQCVPMLMVTGNPFKMYRSAPHFQSRETL